MATTLQFFLDAALTTPVATPVNVQQADDGSSGPVDMLLYLGSTAVGKKFQATSNPGVDQITISIEDAVPAGGDQEATVLKLALTALGLDTAIAGDPLDGGVQILSGVGNALPVYVRAEDLTMTVSTSLEISLQTVSTNESAV
jgi:hypothetical protein